jgi:hypothetical protein
MAVACNDNLRQFVALLRKNPTEAANGETLAAVLDEVDARLNAIAAAMAKHSSDLGARSTEWARTAPTIGLSKSTG